MDAKRLRSQPNNELDSLIRRRERLRLKRKRFEAELLEQYASKRLYSSGYERVCKAAGTVPTIPPPRFGQAEKLEKTMQDLAVEAHHLDDKIARVKKY